MNRRDKLMPDNRPRWIRCYDNEGQSLDQFTVVFTGNYAGRDGCQYLMMSPEPTRPWGVGLHGWDRQPIDRPSYGHLGKRIQFADLPALCQKAVRADYRALWGI